MRSPSEGVDAARADTDRTLQLLHHDLPDGGRALHRHRPRQHDQEAGGPRALPNFCLSALHRAGEDHRRHGPNLGSGLQGLLQPAAARADPDGDRGRRGDAGSGPGNRRAHSRSLWHHRGRRDFRSGSAGMMKIDVIAHLPALQVVIPLLGAVLTAFLRRGIVAWGLAAIVTWLMPGIAGALLWQVLQNGPISYHLGGWPPPWGIEYRVDILSAFVLLLVSAVSAVMMPFARRSVAFEVEGDKQAWFYSMYLLCLTGLLGITITGDAFNAFVFLEISSLSTYVLIAMGRDRRALLASYQYLIMGTIGATFYIIGV